ncbi:HIT family protein [Alphaproteobacteria bacterium]|jgi:diadenosine tetraphosphate (Ap4A) HIT family hydrolase|nr:HIT family protein [Alphaproteobacteria bacterium]
MVNLHPQLRKETIEIVALRLSRVLLLNDSRFPWLILVPDRPGVTELHALNAADKMILISELTVCSRVLESLHRPDKINIGALGNLVPQLHIHVVARFETDAAWPGPVWGFGERQPYSTSVSEDTVTSLRKLLRNELAKEAQQNSLPRKN